MDASLITPNRSEVMFDQITNIYEHVASVCRPPPTILRTFTALKHS
jgi:hypothetical protein